MIQALLEQEVERERQPCQTVGQNAIMDIATAGKVAGQGRRPLPHLASATGILVVAIRQRLAAGEPQSLEEKHGQQSRRNTLRQIEAKAAKDTSTKGHRVQRSIFQSKRPNLSFLSNAVGMALLGAILLLLVTESQRADVVLEATSNPIFKRRKAASKGGFRWHRCG